MNARPPPRPARPGGSSSPEAGFSLTEVAVSLGILAAVLLPLLGMMAGGSGMEVSARDRLAAARIAETIAEQLHYSEAEDGLTLTLSNHYAPGEADPKQIVLPLPSGGGSRATILGCNREGRPVRELDRGSYRSGLPASDGGILHLVRIDVEKSSTGSAPAPGVPGLYRITFSIETPAFADETARSRQTLTTLRSGQ